MMINRRMKALMWKEWLGLRKNRSILLAMAFLPLVMVVTTVGTAWHLRSMPVQEFLKEGSLTVPSEWTNVDARQGVMILMNDQFMFYLLLSPMSLPISIAAYSIIGEKKARSLEPLLATPLKTWELLTAKVLVAVAPAAIAGWLSYLAVVLGIWYVADHVVFGYLVRPVWIVGMILLSPLLAALSTLSGVTISSRMKDIRAANSVAGFFVLPLIVISVAVLLGKVVMTTRIVLWASLIIALLTITLLYLSVKIFNRETILTSWS